MLLVAYIKKFEIYKINTKNLHLQVFIDFLSFIEFLLTS